MVGESCRLCSISNIDSYLNIFSESGYEMEMVNILSEHFKCDISEADPLPNVVCEECWQTTESFHELYKKSREVQEKFLNSFVKSEPDPVGIELHAITVECTSMVKSEPHEDNTIEFSNESSMDSNVNDCDAEGFDDDKNVDEKSVQDDNKHKMENEKQKRKRKPPKSMKKYEYRKLFNEYRHLFDLTCDCCPKVFESLTEAQKHYAFEHNNFRGYIKTTSGSKLVQPCKVVEYIDSHLNKIKCNECDRTFCSKFSLTRHVRQFHKTKIKSKEKHGQSNTVNLNDELSIDGNLNDEPLIDSNLNDIGAEVLDHDNNEEGADENTLEDDTRHKMEIQEQKRKSLEAKRKKDEDYQKLFNEYRHLFDMSCDCCPKVFESLEEAREHYSIEHNKPKGYIKSISGTKLVLPCKVVEYIDSHLNKFKCSVCGRIFCSKHSLTIHVRQCHESETKSIEKLIKSDELPPQLNKNVQPDSELYKQFIAENFDLSCDQCDAIFTTFYEARKHYKDAHYEKNGYIKCCGKKLNGFQYVRDHIDTHLRSATIKCDFCDRTFKTRRLMTRHRLQHRQFICDYCNKVVNSKITLRDHLFTNHVSSEPGFECEICHKKFQLQSLLKNHQYAVHREKKASVTCEICGKSFYAKFFLNKHMVTTHTDKSERLATRKQCEHCGEWLLTTGGIHYHKQLHTSGIQKCEQCGKILPHKVALRRHIIKYHRPHKFKCGYCEKTFAIDSRMRKHEESHTRHNTYQCQFCPKVFNVPSSLQTHKRRNHKEEIEMSKQIENL